MFKLPELPDLAPVPAILLKVEGIKLCPNLKAAVANSLLTLGSKVSKYKSEWPEVKGKRPNFWGFSLSFEFSLKF